MEYRIAAIQTRYKGALFRSRLEARWAAFTDLIGWTWRYEPIDLESWTVDFEFRFQCGHPECVAPRHELYAEVKPYREIKEFDDHRVSEYDPYLVPSPAKFGLDPYVTWWRMDCGIGWDVYTVEGLLWLKKYSRCKIDALWNQAGAITRWEPSQPRAPQPKPQPKPRPRRQSRPFSFGSSEDDLLYGEEMDASEGYGFEAADDDEDEDGFTKDPDDEEEDSDGFTENPDDDEDD
jgi:hypothetical protein